MRTVLFFVLTTLLCLPAYGAEPSLKERLVVQKVDHAKPYPIGHGGTMQLVAREIVSPGAHVYHIYRECFAGQCLQVRTGPIDR